MSEPGNAAPAFLSDILSVPSKSIFAMARLTLEALAQRLEAVEKEIARLVGPPRAKDWRSVVGMFDGSEFMKQVIAEGKAIRQADREAADREATDDQP